MARERAVVIHEAGAGVGLPPQERREAFVDQQVIINRAVMQAGQLPQPQEEQDEGCGCDSPYEACVYLGFFLAGGLLTLGSTLLYKSEGESVGGWFAAAGGLAACGVFCVANALHNNYVNEENGQVAELDIGDLGSDASSTQYSEYGSEYSVAESSGQMEVESVTESETDQLGPLPTVNRSVRRPASLSGGTTSSSNGISLAFKGATEMAHAGARLSSGRRPSSVASTSSWRSTEPLVGRA